MCSLYEFRKARLVAFQPGESGYLPYELQAKCFLNVEAELSTADETGLMVHSDKAWIITVFIFLLFLFF